MAWTLERDTFGFSRMMSDFGFSFTLTPTAEGKTVLRNETYYRTRGLLSGAMNRLVIQRKFRGVRRGFLAKLKRLSEQAGIER
jgi:hypothetical protein